MTTILIAAVPAAMAAITNALGSMARMMTAHTLDEAMEAALMGVDLIIAGTYFDDSRMFDLLQRLKSNERTRDIPILCVRGASAPETFGAQTAQPVFSSPYVVASASKALGAVDYFDLCACQLDLGVAAANEQFVESVRQALV